MDSFKQQIISRRKSGTSGTEAAGLQNPHYHLYVSPYLKKLQHITGSTPAVPIPGKIKKKAGDENRNKKA